MQISRSKAAIVARLALGTLFLVFGLNGFFHFIPQPAQPPPPEALAFAGALFQTGYMFPLIKGTEVVVGLLLLSNRFVPLALTILAPIVVNILAFHLFLAPAGLALPFIITALGIYLATTERAIFAPFFRAKSSEPVPPSERSGSRAAAHA